MFGKSEVIKSRQRHVGEAARGASILQSLSAAPSATPHMQMIALLGTSRKRLDTLLENEPGEVGIWEKVIRLETAHGSEQSALERWAGAEATTLLHQVGVAADA
jgi:hypothetical protein